MTTTLLFLSVLGFWQYKRITSIPKSIICHNCNSYHVDILCYSILRCECGKIIFVFNIGG